MADFRVCAGRTDDLAPGVLSESRHRPGRLRCAVQSQPCDELVSIYIRQTNRCHLGATLVFGRNGWELFMVRGCGMGLPALERRAFGLVELPRLGVPARRTDGRAGPSGGWQGALCGMPSGVTVRARVRHSPEWPCPDGGCCIHGRRGAWILATDCLVSVTGHAAVGKGFCRPAGRRARHRR